MYNTKEFLFALDEQDLLPQAQFVVESMRNGTYPESEIYGLWESTSPVVSIDLVKERSGYGVSLKQADGHEYRYAAEDTHPKYNTPEKLLMAAKKVFKYKGNKYILGWMRNNALLYYGSKAQSTRGRRKKQEADVSEGIRRDIRSMLKEKYPDLRGQRLREEVDFFLEENEIYSDDEYYNLSAKEVYDAL